MIVRPALVLFLLGIATGVASAQTAPSVPVASPAPSATPAGFSGRAHLTVSFPTRSVTINAALQMAIAQRDQLTRFDLLSMQTTIAPIQIGHLTVVMNRSTNTATIWNDTSRVFYTQPLLPPMLSGVAARPSSSPAAGVRRPSRPVRSPLADLDLLTFDLRLTGHAMSAGLPATGLAIDMKVRQHRSLAVSHITGTMQLADDYAFFPAALLLHVQNAAGSAPASLSYTVDAFTRDLPTLDVFDIPAGYTEAPSLLTVVLGIPLRRRTPSPSPSPSPIGSPTP